MLGIIMLSTNGASAERSNTPAQVVAPFLYPPFPGTASLESVFDHSSPNYTFDNKVVVYTVDVANKDCPSPPPVGTPPPQAGVCNAGGGASWPIGLGECIYYHRYGVIDFRDA